MAEENEYILGTHREEIDRLRFQHEAWSAQAASLWRRGDVRPGHSVLDLGCGPGFTSLDLARVVGPRGRVVARDKSAGFLEFLTAECRRLGVENVEPSLGPVEELALAPDSLDAAYARWLLCWLSEPQAVLAATTRALRRGGRVLLQDYLDWGSMKLIPESDVFDTAVAACMRSWQLGGGTIDIGRHLPPLAAACGLRVDLLRPLARIGAVGSLEWRWLGEFFHGYLPRLVAGGLLAETDLAAFRRDWTQRTAEGRSYCYTPVMVDAILTRP